MRMKHVSIGLVLLLALIMVSFVVIPAPTTNASRRTTSTTATTTSTTTSTTTIITSNTYIKTYGNIVSNTAQQKDVFPEDVQATSDGGYIFLASTDCTTQACVAAQSGTNDLVSWLVKTGSSGNPQWKEEVGCFSNPPGDYSLGVSLQQTSDGGYVLGGGTIGCGLGSSCPSTSGIECVFVVKIDSQGKLVWAHVYASGSAGSGINQIKETSDGGFVAVGSATVTAGQPSGALILKLDSQGNVQWQKVLGPTGSTQAAFNAVSQTSDGGYIAVGNLANPTSALVVKFDSRGNVQWQEGFNQGNTESVIQTSDGGYVVASGWSNDTSGFPGQCCKGAVLLKLYSNGNIQWQRAYTSGVYCFFNGYSETCTDLGPFIYSVHQTSDGGCVLAGDANLKLLDGAPIEEWLAKVDSGGNLLWQHLYYQVYQPTGRPLGEYFASATLARDGGFIAVGVTENYAIGLHLLYVVKTDSAGLCGKTCGEVNPATPMTAFNPGLTTSSVSLPLSATVTPGVSSPINDRTTSIIVKQDC
jgi:hypothetical protein